MVDRKKIQEDWRARGFTCDLWVDPPGQVWADFVHRTDELLMPIEGEIELEMSGGPLENSRTLRPSIGEEVLIPSGTTHTVRNVGNTTSQWLYGYKI